jgi:hypothetical protein
MHGVVAKAGKGFESDVIAITIADLVNCRAPRAAPATCLKLSQDPSGFAATVVLEAPGRDVEAREL